MRLPTLYGRASTGKIKAWSIEVTPLALFAWYEVSHGYIDGEIQVDGKQISKGKNIGRANETTPYEQACSQARSAWKKKLDKGYVEDKDNIPYAGDVEYFLPMLAHRYDKRGNKVVWPAYAQPKLDGCRCLARKKNGKVTLWSREGKLFEVPNVLIGELDTILDEGDQVDGEIYVHEWLGKKSIKGRTGFSRIVAALKSWKEDTDNLQYHIYDIPDDKTGFEDRFVDTAARLSKKIAGIDNCHVRIVQTILLNDEGTAMEKFSEVMLQGYEGLMVRNSGGKYKYKNRSVDLQKIKEFDDDEFVIIGGKEATGRDEGTVVFKCQSRAGVARDKSKGSPDATFDARPKGSLSERAEYWDNLDSYIGANLTVRFQGYTDSGKPRFPVGLHIRPDWDKK